MLALTAGPTPTSPSKPIGEMTDEELEKWVTSIRDCRLQHPTMLAECRVEGSKRKPQKPKEPEIEFE